MYKIYYYIYLNYVCFIYNIFNIRKRDDSNIQMKNTIFSKYLALPVATLPFAKIAYTNFELDRDRSGIYFRDKKVLYH